MPISVGTPAPDFTLKSKNDEGLVDITLSSHLGKDVVVLLFFPAAFTGVCTDELCTVSQGLADYASAVVYGISVDLPFSQEAWAKANRITVPLLADTRREVSTAYDVLIPDLIGLGPTSARAAFVIGKDGVVRYAEQTPTPLELPNFERIRETVAGL